MTQNAPTRLAQLRQASLSMLDGLSPAEQRAQPHPELSPMLWHVGHVFFMETYWLAERVFGDSRVTGPWRDLYFPEICAKDKRSARLPGAESLRAWATQLSAQNDAYWREAADYDHPLLQDGYLAAFLRQHYAQHLETMRLARVQLALADGSPARPCGIAAAAPDSSMVTIAPGMISIGTNDITAYDNEQPVFAAHLDGFDIAPRCVSNAQWLGFMQAGGYTQPEFWDPAGWAWRVVHAIDHPQHWRATADEDWDIAADINTDIARAPVHGISWYEARAFARYADARLPREVEWEAAQRHGALADSEQVWQWCDDAFYPYPGFTAFPYDAYSRPWFDGAHFTARGASVHTEIDVRRPGFRNFYPPSHRHVFAGLRLART